MSETLIVALIVSIPPTILATATLVSSIRQHKRLVELHLQVNSRMDQLILASSLQAHAAGLAQGRAEIKEKE